MNKLKINFQLQELDKIVTWGQEPHLCLHWFGFMRLYSQWKIFGKNPNRYSYEAGVMIYLQTRKQLHSFHNGSHRVLYGRTST